MIAIDKPQLSREEKLTSLYKEMFPKVAAFISSSGGSFEDAKDVFQEALVIYYERVMTTTIKDDSAYLLGTARYLWYDMKRKSKMFESPSEQIAQETNETGKPSAEKLMVLLTHGGRKCMDMLSAFYYDKLTMKKLAERFGFGSERSATVQKYKCLEKVRNVIKERALSYEDFIEGN